MIFPSIISTFLNLLSKKPVSTQCTCMKSFHLDIPSMKWFRFFFHHWWRQFSSILLRRNKISKNFLRWFSLRLTSNQFNWFPLIFFQSKRYPRIFIQWNRFSKKYYTEIFSKKFHFTDFNFMEFKSIKTAFFVIPIWKWIASEFPLMQLVLTSLPWKKSTFVVPLCARSSISWLSPEWKQVSWIFKNEINFYRFQFNIFMLHGVTNADRFFPWLSENLKLTSLLFSVNSFPKIFSKKNKSTCFSLRWVWFRCLSLSMISLVFFCVCCPWNSFLGFLTEQLFPWRKSYMKKLISTGFQSIDTFYFVDAPTIFIQ